MTTMLLHEAHYEADLSENEDGVWQADVWYVPDGQDRRLVAVYMDVECPAVGFVDNVTRIER